MKLTHKRSLVIDLTSEEKETIKKYADFIGKIIHEADTPLDFMNVWGGLEDITCDFMLDNLNHCPDSIELDISYITC